MKVTCIMAIVLECMNRNFVSVVYAVCNFEFEVWALE